MRFPVMLGLCCCLAAFFSVLALCAVDTEPPLAAGPLHFPPRTGTYLVLPAEVIDGDTVRFYWLIEDVARLHGINAPELHGEQRKDGEAARAFLQAKLPTRPVPCLSKGREKYGRALIDLEDGNGVSLSKVMIDSGHARPWDGKGSRP